METNNRLLTEKDLIVGNRFECIKSYLDNGIERFTKGLVYSVRDNGLLLKGNRNYFVTTEDLNRHFKLTSQPPVMEGKEETLQDVIKRVSPFGTMTISNPKMLIALEDFIGQKTSSLQSEVEQLKGLLRESKIFCGGSLQARIDNYLSK